MNYLVFYLSLWAVIFIYLFREAWSHEQNLARLSLRIHVNGTRGKSSVTRLIAAGLRSGGHRVVAKTTGTEPKIIYPDGTEQLLKRQGPVNIKENIKVIKTAVQQGADTVVLECMALRPELQNFCEQRLVKSQIGVITNIRADHEDVMGKGLPAIAQALSNTIPRQGVLVTTKAAAALLKQVQPELSPIVAEEQLLPARVFQDFPFMVIPENLALALQVCQLAGVEREVALQGMRQSQPDAGNLHVQTFASGKQVITLVDALAANDPESTLWLWDNYTASDTVKVVLLNCRKDRQYRTRQLCAALAQQQIRLFVLTGDTVFARQALLAAGLSATQLATLQTGDGWQELLTILHKIPAPTLTVFAAGNIKGLDATISNKLRGG